MHSHRDELCLGLGHFEAEFEGPSPLTFSILTLRIPVGGFESFSLS